MRVKFAQTRRKLGQRQGDSRESVLVPVQAHKLFLRRSTHSADAHLRTWLGVPEQEGANGETQVPVLLTCPCGRVQPRANLTLSELRQFLAEQAEAAAVAQAAIENDRSIENTAKLQLTGLNPQIYGAN